MAIDVPVVDLIPANSIELFGNRAQANTNRSGAERLIIELSGMFDYETIKISHSKDIRFCSITEHKQSLNLPAASPFICSINTGLFSSKKGDTI